MIRWGMRTRGLRPIGLDIGHNSIKMIQLAINVEQISVIAADEIRLEGGMDSDDQTRQQAIVSAIREMLARGNFHGKNAVSCLPNGKLRITSLRLTETDDDGIEQALKKEVVQRFGLDPELDPMDYLVAGSVRQGNDVRNELILLATDRDTVTEHIETLEQAGLRPIAIDTVPCALFRSFERSLRRQEDWECTSVFVDVGSRCTTVVFGRGGQISFVKQIPIGGDNFAEEVAAKLGISTAEAEMLRDNMRSEDAASTSRRGLARRKRNEDDPKMDASTKQVMIDAISSVADDLAKEISLCLRYYTVTFRGKRVQKATFAGGGAYEEILLDVLRGQLTVEIEVAQPLKGFDLSSEEVGVHFGGDRRGLLCEWAVAVGLSLKGWNIIEDKRSRAGKQLVR